MEVTKARIFECLWHIANWQFHHTNPIQFEKLFNVINAQRHFLMEFADIESFALRFVFVLFALFLICGLWFVF